MNEFIEKLIGRLEELRNDKYMNGVSRFTPNEKKVFDIAETIVNQLAEEYKDKVIIDGQYCWQTCGATEHCKECNRLCNGSIDYYENYDVLAEEYNNESVKGDLISRSELIKWLKKVTVTDGITFETGFKQILTDIENQTTAYNDGWISCSTDMPDHDQEVFIKFSDGAICNGRFWIAEGTNYCGFDTKFGLFIAEQVMEWKPIAPYKPKGE